MAFVSQELKSKLAPKIRAICGKYGVKASLAVRNHSTLVLNIRQGKIDFIKNFNDNIEQRDPTGNRGINPARDYIQVNVYHHQSHYSGQAQKFLKEVIDAMNEGNFDHSDLQSDYFHVGWYVNVNIGQWNRPYALVR